MKKMNIYEIEEKIQNAILNMVDEETGEIIGDFSELDNLQIELNTKIENIGLFIKNLKSNAEQLKAEEKRLAERRKSIESKTDRLSDYLKNALIRNRLKKVETSKVVLSFRKSTSVEVENAEKLPKEFQKISIDADKIAIKNALKEGATITGATLVEKENLQIR